MSAISRFAKPLRVLLLAGVAALALSACASNRGDLGNTDYSGLSAGQSTASLADLTARYKANPRDANVVIHYAAALRAAGQPQQAMAALEKVVHELEEGQLGLDQAVGRYEAGVNLLKQCHALLVQAERRIELLTGVDAQGAPVVEPFDEQAAASLEEKAKNRAKRRTAGRRTNELPPDVAHEVIHRDDLVLLP